MVEETKATATQSGSESNAVVEETKATETQSEILLGHHEIVEETQVCLLLFFYFFHFDLHFYCGIYIN